MSDPEAKRYLEEAKEAIERHTARVRELETKLIEADRRTAQLKAHYEAIEKENSALRSTNLGLRIVETRFAVVMPLMEIALAPRETSAAVGVPWSLWISVARHRLTKLGIDWRKFEADRWGAVLKGGRVK
jgi:hypothetical protein